MPRMIQTTFASLTVLGLIASANAAITVDGALDGDYGSPLAVQNVGTGFGDNNDTTTNLANGSEIDAAYGVVQGGVLHLFLAGNLETNFNKLDVFIDAASGGMNRLTPLTTDQGSFNRMADDGTGNGLTFDTGFTADHWVSITSGNDPTTIFVDYADLLNDQGNYAGSTTPTSDGTLTGGNGGPASLKVTFNNSNVGGVGGGVGTPNVTDPASVATGIELAVSLTDLGYTGGDINVSAFINGSGQDFLANQVAGPLADGTDNLGEPRSVDFTQQSGNQYFTIAVPEPASLALLGLGGVAAFARRRRSA